MQYKTHSAQEIHARASEIIATLEPGKQATVVTLSGGLGAGKTTFAQGAARALGVHEIVSSPTFVIQKVYALERRAFSQLIHIDAYRLKSAEELRALGFENLLVEPDNLILIEWPEHVAELVPAGALRLRFDIDGDGRIITINGEKEDRKTK